MGKTAQSLVNLSIQSFSPRKSWTDVEWNLLKNKVVETFIPKNTVIDSRPFTAEDFKNVPNFVKPCFNLLESIFISYEPQYFHLISEVQRTCIYAIVVLCGEHFSECFWTTSDCVEMSKTVLKAVLKAFMCADLNYLLYKCAYHDPTNCNSLFNFILPKLNQGNWKYYPSIVECFIWLLTASGRLELKTFLPKFLPFTLSILHDYENCSKVAGLRCLYQLIDKIPETELEQFVELESIRNTLKKILYFREAELIVPVMKCILLLEKYKEDSRKTIYVTKWSFIDEVCCILFPIMESEQNIERRKQYMTSLIMLLNCKIGGRWLKNMLNVIDNYSQTEDTEYEAIYALNLCLRTFWVFLEMRKDKMNLIARRIYNNSTKQLSKIEAGTCLENLSKFPDNYVSTLVKKMIVINNP